jgi:hypothetical protein
MYNSQNQERKMRTSLNRCTLTFFILLGFFSAHSQTCDSTVPTFFLDFSSKADSVWTSPITVRAGNCCGTISPVKCIDFEVNISPAAAGVIVDIIAAQLLGTWQVNYDCVNHNFGDTIFFTSTGVHSLNICNPGNSAYSYVIQSIPDSLASVADIEHPSPIIIWPNPAKSFIIIESKEFKIQGYNIIDLTGKRILSGKLETTNKIEIEALSSGIYFIELFSDKKLSKYKIVKE